MKKYALIALLALALTAPTVVQAGEHGKNVSAAAKENGAEKKMKKHHMKKKHHKMKNDAKKHVGAHGGYNQ